MGIGLFYFIDHVEQPEFLKENIINVLKKCFDANIQPLGFQNTYFEFDHKLCNDSLSNSQKHIVYSNGINPIKTTSNGCFLGGSKFIDFDYRPKIMYNALYKQYTPEFLNFVSRF